MFYTAEDVLPAVSLVESFFGHTGRFNHESNGSPVIKNICLATREYGVLWYGDVDYNTEDFSKHVQFISNSLGQNIFVSYLHDFSDRFRSQMKFNPIDK